MHGSTGGVMGVGSICMGVGCCAQVLRRELSALGRWVVGRPSWEGGGPGRGMEVAPMSLMVWAHVVGGLWRYLAWPAGFEMAMSL